MAEVTGSQTAQIYTRLEDMSPKERSLLLFLETQAVDHSGAVGMAHTNAEERAIMERWTKAGFIESGRIRAKDIEKLNRNNPSNIHACRTMWVRLSPEAWTLVAQERRERAYRTWANRTWRTTKED